MSSEATPKVSTYVRVWFGLIMLLLISLESAYIPLGTWNTVINIGIAVIQAGSAAIVFMHLRQSNGLIRIFAAGGIIWLMLLLGLTLLDVLSRHIPLAPW